MTYSAIAVVIGLTTVYCNTPCLALRRNCLKQEKQISNYDNNLFAVPVIISIQNKRFHIFLLKNSPEENSSYICLTIYRKQCDDSNNKNCPVIFDPSLIMFKYI